MDSYCQANPTVIYLDVGSSTLDQDKKAWPTDEGNGDVAIVMGEDCKTFRDLVEKEPSRACKLLDKCCTYNKEKSEAKFDYKYLKDEVEQPNHVLELIKSSDLLKHPVVRSLLSWKWKHYIAIFYFSNLAIFMVYLSFLTTFALNVPNPQLSICTGNGSNITTSSTCELSSSRRVLLTFAAFVTGTLSIVRLFIEVGQFFNFKKILPSKNIRMQSGSHWFKKDYLKSPSNYLEIPMYIFSILFVAVSQDNCLCPSHWQWRVGTLAVFFAWIDFILFLNKLPFLGIYIGMIWKITVRFLMVSVIAVLLLLAFGFAFYMAFYEPHLPDTPFETPIVTFVTMISYAIDGPDNSIFRLSNDDTMVENIPYPVVSYFIWITFGVIMSVLFLNFLIGLAVDDVGDLKKQADAHRIRLSIKLFREVEGIINVINTLTSCCCSGCCEKIERLIKKKSPASFTATLTSKYVKYVAIWCGDEIKDIIQQAQDLSENEEKAKEPVKSTAGTE